MLEVSSRCRFCRRPRRSACLRCGVPLCDEHAHGDAARCVACERDFRTSPRRRAAQIVAGPICVAGGLLSGFAVGVVAAYFLGQLGAIFGVAPVFALFGLVTFTVGGAAAGGAAARTMIDGPLRSEFLLERTDRPARLPRARVVRAPDATRCLRPASSETPG